MSGIVGRSIDRKAEVPTGSEHEVFAGHEECESVSAAQVSSSIMVLKSAKFRVEQSHRWRSLYYTAGQAVMLVFGWLRWR